ncbi:uncharacterized protein [Coffea arabica]|uniref:Uncharacterized protein isoform X5 n=1 Tax=Coffea arabica TaxID=13443 RepID=A0A6P6SLX7_COFAR|nr:receptor-like serine/threonine-protein kinase ALE2 isoform X6 [Coffea arabica]
MGVVVLQVVFSVLKVTVLAAFLAFQGSSGYSLPPSPSTFPVFSPGGDAIAAPPTPAGRPNGTFVDPPLLLPPLNSASAPQKVKDHIPSLPPSTLVLSPSDSMPIPVIANDTVPPLPTAPRASPSRISPQSPPTSLPLVPESVPPKPAQSRAPEAPFMATAPASNTHASKRAPQNSLPPGISSSILPVPVGLSPGKSPGNPLSIPPALPKEPPSTSSEPDTAPASSPVATPPNGTSTQQSPVSTSPAKAPSVHDNMGNSDNAPPPLPSRNAPVVSGSNSPASQPSSSFQWHHGKNYKRTPAPSVYMAPPPASAVEAPSVHDNMGNSDNAPSPLPSRNAPVVSGSNSPAYRPSSSFQWHHGKNYKRTPAPSVYMAPPPASAVEAPPDNSSSDPKTDFRFHAPPPLNPGSSTPSSHFPFPTPKSHDSSSPSPHPSSSSQQMPIHSPKMSPTRPMPRMPKMPLQPPLQALPPPPPNGDCTSLTCSEPLTNGAPGSPCVCVLPMQVGLRLSVALYNFFPLVSEFAAEVAAGVFLKPSQVRIMGANAASQDPEKTIVLTDLVPLGETFDNTTAYLTFRRFWLQEVIIQTSLFGDYEVLYVHYPGLPPSPPSASSDIGTIETDPYSSRNNNGAAIKPFGVDVGRQHHRGGLSRSVIAIIVLSTSIVVIFCCAIAWVLVLKHREQLCPPDSTPPATMPSLAKSSGIPASMIGSGPSSASLSYGSSIAAYAGSTKSFSTCDIEKATDNFSETRILGEGGFGRVYSGVLEDGTHVAVKVLKRADQQGGREFLSEIEMLSRLHHRNLVKLIGICTEERTRCLIYELIPNGSVESHLHGNIIFCLYKFQPCFLAIFICFLCLLSGVHQEYAPLDWGARLKIALGAARGLAYLHEDSSPRVIHRDFKSSNILLEHDFTPKVSDFGLARTALDEENKHISTRVMGTFGYVAPEYAMTGHLLVKSDVYSYGVVLLELLTGRKPVDMSQPPGQENLVSWARPVLTSEEGLESIIDPTLGPDLPFDGISKVAAIASMCVQPEVSNRPFMGEVVQALKLICNECDETKEMGSRSCSQEDLSLDMDTGISNTLDPLGVPLHGQSPVSHYGQSPVSHYDSEVDVERGISVSDLLSSSARYAMQDSGPLGRRSGSGPLTLGKARQLWQKMRRLSGGTVSEHGLMFKSWRGSR